MKSLFITLLIGLLSPVFTVAADTDLSPYISKLEEAAEVCDNSMFSTSECTRICTDSAEKFKQAKTVSGISRDTEKAIINCMTAMAANEDGRISSLFNQVGALLATLSTELFKLQLKSTIQNALSKENIPPASAVVQQVKVDSNIYAANGQVDSNKISSLYDNLAQVCQSQGGGMMIDMCTKTCRNKKTEVVGALDAIKQAPKNISATDRERNTYNLLQTIDIDLNMGCGMFFKEMTKVQQPSSYLALVEFVGLIRKGVWPPKPVLSLDLALDEPTPEAKQAEQLASLKAENALNTFNFTQAISAIKSMPDYHTLENAVQAIPYSAEQIHTSLTDLLSKESSYTSQRRPWLDKVQELGLVGRQKELFEAINSSCEMDYLQTFNKQTDWQVKKVDTRQNMYGNAQKAPFEQLLSPVHLHRFCYQELANRLVPQYDQKKSRSDLQTLADNYISQAPVDPYKAVAGDSEPARVMSEENWLPSWTTYKQLRTAEFVEVERLAKEERDRLAKAQAEVEGIARIVALPKQDSVIKGVWLTECKVRSPTNFEGKFGPILDGLDNGCKKTVTVVEQVFAGGVAAQFIKVCGIPKAAQSRSKIKKFIASQLLKVGIGHDFGGDDLGNTMATQTENQIAWSEGAMDAEKIGCGSRADKIISNLESYINSTSGKDGKPSRFVQGCVAHYEGDMGYDVQKCQCVADIGRTVFARIHESAFEPETFRKIIKANPLLAGQMIYQCKAIKY